MTLTREQRAAYGEEWPELSRSIREDRAEGRCECHGECLWLPHLERNGIVQPCQGDIDDPDRRCDAVNGQPSPYTGSRVVLTVAHLDRNAGDPGHEDPERLRAMCQGCHLSYDRQPTTQENHDG